MSLSEPRAEAPVVEPVNGGLGAEVRLFRQEPLQAVFLVFLILLLWLLCHRLRGGRPSLGKMVGTSSQVNGVVSSVSAKADG